MPTGANVTGVAAPLMRARDRVASAGGLEAGKVILDVVAGELVHEIVSLRIQSKGKPAPALVRLKCAVHFAIAPSGV
jgi:hypothetical protein